jgi:hypothetical protein
VWLVATLALAADSEKLDEASVVVQGKVRTIFREENGADAVIDTFLYEVVVEKVEKAGAGAELKEGKVLYARAVRLREGLKPIKGSPPPMAFTVKPAVGDTVRVYCDRLDDGLYRVRLNPTAIKVLKPAKER